MGHKADQTFLTSTYRPTDQPTQSEDQLPLPQPYAAPPLQPRVDPNTALSIDAGPPPYSETAPTYHSQPLAHSWSSQDPRSSSTQSLPPHTPTEGNGKRRLLLVYVHGFMGNETSFQSFPAHVHNSVTVKLKETHVVHTKIYPRYKSRKRIEFARDGFSEWLRPHEGPGTDVILLGHSMGGILSAEVALLNVHRILGTINFDTPFLGMHPGVIASGLGSLFQRATESTAPTPQAERTNSLVQQDLLMGEAIQDPASLARHGSENGSITRLIPTKSTSTVDLPTISPLSVDLPTKDPNYDPPFTNDIRLPQRTGWANALHFINKHSEGLTKATQAYVKSHLEFGGAMADYKGLKIRYEKLRALEDFDVHDPARIRFVNYYTASTGRLKKPRSTPTSRNQTGELEGGNLRSEGETRGLSLRGMDGRSPSSNPQAPIDVQGEKVVAQGEIKITRRNSLGHDHRTDDESATSEASQNMEDIDPVPMAEDECGENENHNEPATLQSASSRNPSISITDGLSSLSTPVLPPVPPTPEEPPAFDPTLYPDKDTRKLAEKEHARQIKAYQRAVKDHDKIISDRRRFLEKREKNAAKEREKVRKIEEKNRMTGMEKGEKERAEQEAKQMKNAEKEQAKLEKEEKKRIEKQRAKMEKEAQKKAATDTISLSKISSTESEGKDDGFNDRKPKRDKKFCMLPPQINGQIDPCWVRIFMPGVDEVGAHCGLFFVDGDRYRSFVGDVAERIEKWVEESSS